MHVANIITDVHLDLLPVIAECSFVASLSPIAWSLCIKYEYVVRIQLMLKRRLPLCRALLRDRNSLWSAFE